MKPPDKRKPGMGTPANATTKTYRRPEDYTDPHDIAMFGLAWRIAWLSRRRLGDRRYPRHWWLRTASGRMQLEFLERREAA